MYLSFVHVFSLHLIYNLCFPKPHARYLFDSTLNLENSCIETLVTHFTTLFMVIVTYTSRGVFMMLLLLLGVLF